MSRRRLSAIAMIAWLLAVSSERAQALDPSRALTQCIHRIWQAQQGLPQPTINCVLQTSNGYLWLGTRTGLVRFDGARFTMISDRGDARLEQAWIHDLAEDHDHALWIATDGEGLIRFKGGQATRFGSAQGLPSETVSSLLVDRSGRLWIGTDRGLARLEDGKLIRVGESEGLPPLDVGALCQGQADTIWVAGEHGQLFHWDGKKFRPRKIDALTSHDVINAVLETPDGTLWIGSSNGLIQWKDGDEKRITTADGLAGDVIFCLAGSAGGDVWVGTKDGFSRVRSGEIESFRTADGLSQSTVYDICQDSEGSLWVGTKHGLNQFVDRRTVPFTSREGLPSNATGPIAQDCSPSGRGGTIWVGTLDAGLARFTGRRFEAARDIGLPSKTIRALSAPDNGGLWIGTDRGLSRFEDGRVSKTFTVDDGLPSNDIRCLCPAASGTLWIGTTAGLASLRDQAFDSVKLDDQQRVSVLAMVDCGEFLLVSLEGRGVYRCAGGKLMPEFERGGDTAEVDCFYRDSDQRVWMGTRDSGLRMFDDGKLHHFTSKDGLYDDNIYGIVSDSLDRLWMACSKGIFSVPRADLKKFAAGELKRVTCTALTPLDALRTIECQEDVQPCAQRAQDGRVWFATIRGLMVLDPQHLQRRLPPTPVVVEEVIVNGQYENPRELQTIGPGQANVSFHYSALSFASPSRITFRYQLEGFDKDWVEAGSRREAFYTNLPPGNYQFRVAATNADGKEYPLVRGVMLDVLPHFYQRAWFLPLCVALAALAVWSGYRLRVRRIREHLNVVLAERSRIARELHDTLMQGFSGVTMEMQALSTQLPASDERATLNEIIKDAGNCLREARRSVAGLRGNQSTLAASLAETARQLTETRDVRLKLQLEPNTGRLAADVEYNLLRIAQEGVSNAVKHAQARNIEVTLAQRPQELQMSIRDDGLGFPAGDGAQIGAGHYGLIGMRERARQIGAALDVQSQPGAGTSIRVVLPTNGAASKPSS